MLVLQVKSPAVLAGARARPWQGKLHVKRAHQNYRPNNSTTFHSSNSSPRWLDQWNNKSIAILPSCTSPLLNITTHPLTTLSHSYWILLPITVVMILTGILRHYLSTLLQTTPKRQPLPKIREQRSLLRAANLRANHMQVSKSSFEKRREWWIESAKEGKFLADPDARGKGKPNPLSDPAMMEGMMGMMKGNVAMMVPQTLIMGWINAFFSGYVICEFYLASIEREVLMR